MSRKNRWLLLLRRKRQYGAPLTLTLGVLLYSLNANSSLDA